MKLMTNRLLKNALLFFIIIGISATVVKAQTVTNFVSSNLGLSGPEGLAFDASGNLYVANYNSNTISKVTPAGVVTTFVSTGLSQPTGLVFDASGILYVANWGSNTISKVTPSGVVSTFVSSGLFNPWGLAFDASGNLYVGNNGYGVVSKVNPAGTVSTFAGTFANGDGLAFDASGNLYVADASGKSNISKVTPSGIVSTFVSSGLATPIFLAFDASGNLYVNNGNSTISKVNSTGVVSTFVSSGLNLPMGLAFDASGNLYVANYNNNTISKVIIPIQPTITSFTPASATSGTTITIKGNYFTGTTSVSFGAVSATSFSVVNDSTITAVVGSGASGSISVTSPAGTASLPGFVYCTAPVTNSISLSSCNSVLYKGVTYYTSMVIRDTVKSMGGCDSIYNIATLTVNKITPVSQSSTLSANDSLVYEGIKYYLPAVVSDTVKSVGGCDSIYHVVNIMIYKSFSGNILSPKGITVPYVNGYVSGSTNQSNTGNGAYLFNLPYSSSGTVKLYKNNDVNKVNGVTALDVALIQTHILHKTLLNSPYKIIAADVDGDGDVSVLDMILIKRLDLGLDTTLKNSQTGENRLWVFVDGSYTYPDTTNPFPIKNYINFSGLTSNINNQSFIGIKLGDVNWDWNPAIPRTNNNLINTNRALNNILYPNNNPLIPMSKKLQSGANLSSNKY